MLSERSISQHRDRAGSGRNRFLRSESDRISGFSSDFAFSPVSPQTFPNRKTIQNAEHSSFPHACGKLHSVDSEKIRENQPSRRISGQPEGSPQMVLLPVQSSQKSSRKPSGGHAAEAGFQLFPQTASPQKRMILHLRQGWKDTPPDRKQYEKSFPQQPFVENRPGETEIGQSFRSAFSAFLTNVPAKHLHQNFSGFAQHLSDPSVKCVPRSVEKCSSEPIFRRQTDTSAAA